jgi:hypothetical protein
MNSLFFHWSLFTTTNEFTQNIVKSLWHNPLQPMNSLKILWNHFDIIQWNHLAYKDTFCCSFDSMKNMNSSRVAGNKSESKTWGEAPPLSSSNWGEIKKKTSLVPCSFPCVMCFHPDFRFYPQFQWNWCAILLGVQYGISPYLDQLHPFFIEPLTIFFTSNIIIC